MVTARETGCLCQPINQSQGARNLRERLPLCKWRQCAYPDSASIDPEAHPGQSQAVDSADIEQLNAAIRDVPDFPKEGIVFKDITPVLGDPVLFRLAIDGLIEAIGSQRVDKIVGIDARGFIFGAAVADRIGAGLVPIRKKGKLPWRTREMSYALEYGEATVQIHEDAIREGENILLVDDLLATGGTAAAALHLVKQQGANIIGAAFFIELDFLDGRAALEQAVSGVPITALLNY